MLTNKRINNTRLAFLQVMTGPVFLQCCKNLFLNRAINRKNGQEK
jgi:hypothetical protein